MKISQSALTDDFLLVCGPCAAESESQLLQTALSLKPLNLDYFRAGLWKPRTRPGDFEGVGAKGLIWLKKVKQLYGYKVATEVATPEMVNLCLENDVDCLWLGARTVSNPFLTEDIAKTLRGTDAVVMVKNPVNPDLKLWLGGIERLERQGVKNIIAVHRGFSQSLTGKYRQAPLWRIAMDFKRQRSDLKLICDPSHIAGNSLYVQEICQTAVSIGFDGLMTEVHSFPHEAKTDAKQQITPEKFKEILSNLTFADKQSDKADILLNSLREQINETDEAIINALALRMDISKQIAKIKKDNNLSIFQNKRWSQVVKEISDLAQTKGLDVGFIQELYDIIHQESVKIQNLIINKSPN